MSKLLFDYSKALEFVSQKEIDNFESTVNLAKETLINKKGAGADFLGWLDLPVNYDKEEFERIKKAAKKIQSDSEVLVVIGIGGSYLGAKACIEALSHSFYALLDKTKRPYPHIVFCGNSISEKYLHDLEEAKGALKKLTDEEGYESFVVPDDVGGRFSVLTAVGLLPIAVAGIDIDRLMSGAAAARKSALEKPYKENPALLYAAMRNIIHRKGKAIEILANYEPSLHYISEWWKQLYGESEGKDNKGIYPASVDLTTDLHSMGQFIQEGSRILYETVISIEKPLVNMLLEEEEKDTDGMNYLAGKSIDFVNKSAMNGTILAHTDGGVPNLSIVLPELNEEYLGELFYFFEFACGVSGYILAVNPFNQPGVESYKKNMFALLGKPGFEKEREELIKRL